MNSPLELHWSGQDLLNARQTAFRHLHLRMDHATPNRYLRERLGLPADALRAQRLIAWAKQKEERGER